MAVGNEVQGDMGAMEKINVDLYGGKSLFGKKETPLVADEIYCSMADSCQFHEHGTCMCCRASFAMQSCPYGSVNRIKGYTSKAKKYKAFRSKYREDALFELLNHPRDAYLRIVGDYVYVNLPYTSLSYAEEPDDSKRHYGSILIGPKKNIAFGDAGLLFSCSEEWIPKSDIDADTIAAMASFKPRAAMDGRIIGKYQEKIVPAFIDDIRCFWEEMYGELESRHPEVCNLEVDYRGRRAYLKTLKTGIALKSCTGEFLFDGDSLVCNDFNDVLVSVAGIEARKASLIIPIDDTSTVEIQDNSWVVPGQTRFV